MTSSIPTPGDIARRHQGNHLIAPGPHNPASDEPYRELYERGITGSLLHRNAKLVALTLASHADWVTGQIPDGSQPHLAGLAEETALVPGRVAVSLQALESRGWIQRSNRRERWDTAAAQLTIPGPIMRHLKKPRPA